MPKFTRSLSSRELVEEFLDGIEYDLTKKMDCTPLIANLEKSIDSKETKEDTVDHTKNRHRDWRDESKRWIYRKEVVQELLTKKRLDSDDKITKGKGGALPKTKIKSKNIAIIVIGLPASGKSYYTNALADRFGCMVLDSDYAKRKLPEYKDDFVAATLLHEESSGIIFGFSSSKKPPSGFEALMYEGFHQNYNLIIPKIGHNVETILNLAKTLRHKNYKIHLVLTSCDRQIAVSRAIDRFIETKRYVPLSLIFDGYANDPTRTYYRLKRDHKELFDSFGKISTEDKHTIVETYKNSPVKKITLRP